MKPFDDSSRKIGGLTIESSADAVSLYGDLDITRDKAGLAIAEEVQAIVNALVDALKDDANLPDKLPAAATSPIKPNPFG